MALTIDELNIQIAAESTKATSAIDNLVQKIQTLQIIFGPLATTNIKVSNSFNTTTKNIQNTTTKLNQYKASINKASNSAKSFTDRLSQKISKTRTLIGAFKTVSNTMGSWFNESNGYIETLNLFNVTMGDGAEEAMNFAEKVQNLMGIDIAEWMQYQGVFKNLTAGFGVASDKANIMSQNLTQLSYDMASFFNTDVEKAFDKLSSAMSGQVKGLREFGIDTTVASLQEYALAKGIDAKVRSMTQAEKSMLRYNYIMEKSTIMQGDMARTLVTPANALRILSAQLTQMKRALGNIVSVIAVKFIPYVQAIVEIIRDAANAIADFFEFEIPKIDYSGLGGNLSGEFEDAEDSLDGVSGSLKKIKKQMMGFDELNIINNPDTDSGAGGSGVGGSGGLGNMDLLEYDFLKNLKTDKLDEIKKKLKDILWYVGTIAAGITAWKFTDAILGLAGVEGALKRLPMLAGVTLAITGAILEIKGISSIVTEGINTTNLIETLLGGGSLIAGGALIGEFIGGIGLAISTGIASIIAGMPMYFVGIYDAIKNGLNWMNGLLIPLGSTLAGAGIGAIIGSLGGPIGAGIGALIGLGVGLISDFTIWLWQNFDKITNWFQELPLAAQIGIGGLVAVATVALTTLTGGAFLIPVAIATVIAAIKTKCFGLIDWVDQHIVEPLKKAATWVYETIVAPIIDSIKKVFNYAREKYTEIKDGILAAVVPIINKVVEIYNKVKEIFSALWWAFKEYFWNPIVGKVEKVYDDYIKPVVDKVKNAFTTIKDWFKEKIYDKIVEQVDKMKQKIEGIGTAVVDFISNSFKTVINGIFSRIETFINTFIRGLNAAVGIVNKIPGVNITTVSLLSIPRLAEGGIVNEGQMFIAREAGPELVGNIGRKTAVANNDQIISGIESGVYRAMVAANSNNKGGSQTIHIITEIDGDVVGEKVIQYHNGKVMQTGVSPLLV